MVLGLTASAYAGDAADSGTARQRYTFSITTNKAYISGIMITADTGDTINGSMVNEFGISAIDFVYDRSRQRVKLVRVIDFLNKWYIRRVLAADIKYCLHVLRGIPAKSGRGYEVTETDGTVTVTNTKRKISYTFSPLSTPDDDDTERQPI